MPAACMHIQMIQRTAWKYIFTIKSGSTAGTEITFPVWFVISFKIEITSYKLIYFCVFSIT